MKRILTVALAAVVLFALVSALLSPSPQQAVAGSQSDIVKRGEYLVKTMGCADCHTPMKMGPNGPEPDMSMMLAGHPAKMVMTDPPKLEAPWMGVVSSSMTAWAGPWGISYSANLTPDPETGMGKWTEKEWMAMVQTMRHRGKGRPILPPMPTQVMQHLTEDDLRAVFAYLQSIPPVSNKVPEPKSPDSGM